jgi:hypothetical protein
MNQELAVAGFVIDDKPEQFGGQLQAIEVVARLDGVAVANATIRR